MVRNNLFKHDSRDSPTRYLNGNLNKVNEINTLFIRHSSQGKIATLIAYVDDIIVAGDDLEEIMQLKKSLSNEFRINDLGALKYFLGLEVVRCNHGIFVS